MKIWNGNYLRNTGETLSVFLQNSKKDNKLGMEVHAQGIHSLLALDALGYILVGDVTIHIGLYMQKYVYMHMSKRSGT